MSRKDHIVYTSSKTGKYVSAEYAAHHPATTESHRVGWVKHKAVKVLLLVSSTSV